MSEKIKLIAALPGGKEATEFNGLDAKADWFLEHPEDLLVCVTVLGAKWVRENLDEGTRVPHVRVRRIEPIGEVSEIGDALRNLMSEAAAKRLGRPSVPLEVATVSEGYDPDQTTIDDAVEG